MRGTISQEKRTVMVDVFGRNAQERFKVCSNIVV